MPAPNQMFEHALTAIKGWFEMAALDFAAKLSPNVTIEAYGGRVVHLNAQQEFEMGIANTQMAIFLLQNSSSFDVSNPGLTLAGNFMHQSIMPRGDMSGLVASGGYELQTTEFDQEPTRAYAPNQLLTAKADNTDADTGGVITNDRAGAGGSGGAVQQYVHAACGVVSRGQSLNEHGVKVLTFWTIYLPAAA